MLLPKAKVQSESVPGFSPLWGLCTYYLSRMVFLQPFAYLDSSHSSLTSSNVTSSKKPVSGAYIKTPTPLLSVPQLLPETSPSPVWNTISTYLFFSLIAWSLSNDVMCYGSYCLCHALNESLPTPSVNSAPLRLQSSLFKNDTLWLLIWASQDFPKRTSAKTSLRSNQPKPRSEVIECWAWHLI